MQWSAVGWSNNRKPVVRQVQIDKLAGSGLLVERSTATYTQDQADFQVSRNGIPIGVTRATRIAKLTPGERIQVEVIGELPRAYASLPKIGDLLP